MTNDSIQRYTVSGDIAYPINEDPEGDYVTYEDHVAAIEAYRQRRGEVVVTKTPEGEIIAVTRQDAEGKILSVIAEADRKRRGEVVKTVADDLRSHASMARWQAHSLSWLLDAISTHGAQKAATLSAAMSNLERMAMRLEDSANYIDMYAPQSAEPSGASTLHNAGSGAQNGIQATQPAEPVKGPNTTATELTIRLKDMRVLLAHYSQPCPHCDPVDGKYGPRVQAAWHAGWDAAQEARDSEKAVPDALIPTEPDYDYLAAMAGNVNLPMHMRANLAAVVQQQRRNE